MNLQQLANELNVTEKEVIALIKMIYISMNKDSVGEMLLNMDEKDKVEMVNAYVQSEVKKFSEFCVTLLTNEEKRKAFELYVQSQVI